MDELSSMPVQPAPQIPTGPKHFGPKTIAIIVAILLIGGTAYSAIWYWQQSQLSQEVVPTFTPRAIDETANWKTYRNDQYGFEFKYPNNFYVQTVPGNSIRITTINKELLNFEGDAVASIEIEEIFKDVNDKLATQKDIINNYQEKQIQVGDRDAQLVGGVLNNNVFGWGGENHGYVFIDKTPIRLEYDSTDLEVSSIFNQILSTFKFTDSKETDYINSADYRDRSRRGMQISSYGEPH